MKLTLPTGFALAVITSCLLCVHLSAATADTTIDTTPFWDRFSVVGAWGTVASGATPTFGQVITAPSDHFLTSFSFELQTQSSQQNIGYTADVFAWNGTSATGTAVYQSPVLFTSGLDLPFGYTETTVNVPSLNLTVGSQYVLFFTTVGQSAGRDAFGRWGQPQNQDVYSGGGFVFNNGVTAASITSGTWDQNFLGPGGDLAFKATFTTAAVPEPCILSIPLGVGIAGAGYWFQRRRRKTASA